MEEKREETREREKGDRRREIAISIWLPHSMGSHCYGPGKDKRERVERKRRKKKREGEREMETRGEGERDRYREISPTGIF